MIHELYKNQHLDRYASEFDFIPNVLTSLWKNGDIDNYIMTHPIEWKKILKKRNINSDFGIEKISVVEEEINDDKIKFIFTFPEPKISPECYYAILFIDNEGNSKYFTLELDMMSILQNVGGGMICGENGDKHINYGRRCRNNLKDFEKKVQDILDGKNEQIEMDIDNLHKIILNNKNGINKEDCNIF